ncbi:hypothetical protein [Streptomyces spinosirectus]
MGWFSTPLPPTPEERRAADPDVANRRRADAARHYERTGDSSRMWEEKNRHVDAARKVKDYDSTPAGRRAARRARRNGN